MTNDILRYGGLAGLIVGIPLFALSVTMGDQPPPSWGMVLGFGTMLVAFSLIFVAVKRRRDGEGGGVIRFWPAFGMGLGIAFVASLFWVGAWEFALAVSDNNFAHVWAEQMVANAKAKGLGAAEVAKIAADMAEFERNYANPPYRMMMSFTEIFPIGAVVALIAAAVLRNPRVLPARRIA